MGDFGVTKLMDKASPTLMSRVWSGESIKSASIVRFVGNQKTAEWTLSDVIVTSHDVKSDGSSRPAEAYTFSFGQVAHKVTTQRGATSAATYNVAKNTVTP